MNGGSGSAYRVADDGSLTGSRCDICGHVAYPPRQAHCDRAMSDAALEPVGRVESFSDVHIAPACFGTPYRIGYVRLASGPRVVTRFIGELASMADPRNATVSISPAPAGLNPGLVASLSDAQ